ncbi:MAG TPA: hypothetical protein VFQ61_04975 [Polyangiaceae bacterium]|nr:hypothetical protein [Polyangiaceae bacterium]
MTRPAPKAFLKRRLATMGFAAVLACVLRLPGHGAPRERSLEELAHMLGKAADVQVSSQSIFWEPAESLVAELWWGRRLLFLGAASDGKHSAPRDVFRARVRLTFDGTPIQVTEIRNLTQTPHADEIGLKGIGSRAAFATVSFGRVQAVSVLETTGVRPTERPQRWFDQLLLAVSSYQETGTFLGLGRTDIVLDVPAASVELQLTPSRLALEFGDRGRNLTYALDQRSLRAESGADAYGARVLPEVHGAKPLVLWMVDTVREEVGPTPIAWLEKVAFGAKDRFKRTTYSWFAPKQGRALRAANEPARARILEPSALMNAGDTWPPPRVPSLWKSTEPGEGEWAPVAYGFLKPMRGTSAGEKPPPYFYRTYIRPDRERPYSKVHLIAMDMRQLEIGMQAGYEDPKPTAGPPGEGKLPRDPAIYERVVATFNGAFKTTHGSYGMMVQRRVLLPPVKGGASVIVNDAHEVGLGSWPQSDQIPADVVSFRQNLDPLLEDGVPNPTGRLLWGWQLEGTSVMTQRTGLCVTPAGHLYYAFGTELDGKTLGQALYQAGCSYAIHLDMNPAHCGFVFSDIRNPRTNDMTLRLASDDMRIAPDKYARWSAKDFFYVMVRDAVPHDGSGLTWTQDEGTQPPPSFLPGVFRSKLGLGKLQIELLSVEKGRADFRVRAGAREPARSTQGSGLSSEEEARVLGALGLGHSTDAVRLGLVLGENVLIPLRSGYATLRLSQASGPQLLLPSATPALLGKEEQAIQLPLLAEGGQLLERAHERGALRARAALCVSPAGRLLVARAEHDSSDALAEALIRSGCENVAELDRGSHYPAFLHRAGTSTPPVDGYEASVLYVLSRNMVPHAFRWKPDGSVPSTMVTSYDVPHPGANVTASNTKRKRKRPETNGESGESRGARP